MEKGDIEALVLGLLLILAMPVRLARCCYDVLKRPDGGGGGRRRVASAAAASAPVVLVPVLPARRYEVHQRGDGAGGKARADCAICLELFRQGDLCGQVPACRHLFHTECIQAWMKKNDTCPLCRAGIVVPGSGSMPADVDMVV